MTFLLGHLSKAILTQLHFLKSHYKRWLACAEGTLARGDITLHQPDHFLLHADDTTDSLIQEILCSLQCQLRNCSNYTPIV